MNSILESIREWSIANFVNDETLILMLIGSSTHSKEFKDINDVDILIILENSIAAFSKEELEYENIKIDKVTIGDDYLRQLFSKDAENIFDLNLQSAFFEPIQDGVIWYNKYNKLINIVEIAKKWTWNIEYQQFFEFDLQEPKTQLFRNGYLDQLRFLNTLKERLRNNLGISYRRKDLPEITSTCTKVEAQHAKEKIIQLYNQLSVEEEWEFVPYVQIAMNKGEWGKALDNLKDILQGLIYRSIPKKSKNYFDPSIWAIAEENGVSEELMKAIETIYLRNKK